MYPKNSILLTKFSISLLLLLLCNNLLLGQRPTHKLLVRFTNAGKVVESTTLQVSSESASGSPAIPSFFCASTNLSQGNRQPTLSDWVSIPKSKLHVAMADRTQEFTLRLDGNEGWAESLELKPGDEILTKVVLPEGFELVNKRALEAEGRYSSDKPNEVIIAIKIPGAALTVDEEGQMSMTASGYFLGTILSLILLRFISRNWKHRAKLIARKPRKTEQLQVKELIRKGKLSRGLERLSGILHYFDYEMQKEIELLTFQLSAIIKERELGRLSTEHFTVEQNRITGAALSLLREIE
ncbi:MAG: hypothetical protein HRU41_06465 [Saprospiraceae bacterium]|nr:hypothetical protein [Saprospiraceae bacterium]